jgi:hypothetical protein
MHYQFKYSKEASPSFICNDGDILISGNLCVSNVTVAKQALRIIPHGGG